LAERLRPKTLEDFAGQIHLLGTPEEPGLLRRAILNGTLGSAIFYGPPGCGKTTLARIAASTAKASILEINASESSVADIRRAAEFSKENLRAGAERRTLLFIDEIHRFNKGQQDALLPHVENGTLQLIGATTENPFFSIVGPLLSRCVIFPLEPLETKDVGTLIKRGLEELGAKMEGRIVQALADKSNGDPRTALNALELAFRSKGSPNPALTEKDIAQALQQKSLRFDKGGDNHYDIISAFIKSMRGSDPDATLYWLARMIASGEEPRYIARRLVVHAAEDVGLADPSALQSATAAQSAVETIGMPEAKIPLAMAALHIALAPKSNSACAGISKALGFVTEDSSPAGPPPPHLRDSHYQGAQILGHGEGYKFPHDHPGGYVEQNYFPEALAENPPKLYENSRHGLERELNERLETIKETSSHSPKGPVPG
jgi:putative ATPase